MSETEQKPKKALIAVLLSLILTGTGQFYVGRFGRGIALLGALVLPGIFTAVDIVNPNTQGHPKDWSVFYFVVYIYAIIDSYFGVKSFNVNVSTRRRTPKFAALLLFILAYYLFCVGAALYIRANYLQPFKIPSKSMVPTLEVGDQVMVDKTIYKRSKPQRGDVIVFPYPVDSKKLFMQRIIAVGGEAVAIKNGKIYIDGKEIQDPRIERFYYYNDGDYGREGQTVNVPQEFVYVLGDNSGFSHDSRFWGFVPEAKIVGKAYKIYAPDARYGLLNK